MWLSGEESACQSRSCGFDPRNGQIPWRRAWQPTPVFLPGESHGQRSLVGYSPWGCKQSDTNQWLNKYKTVAKNFPKTSSVDVFTRWKSKPLWPVLFFPMDRSDQIMILFRNLYLSTFDLIPVFSDALYCPEKISSSLFSLQTPILFCTCLSTAFSPKVTPPPTSTAYQNFTNFWDPLYKAFFDFLPKFCYRHIGACLTIRLPCIVV